MFYRSVKCLLETSYGEVRGSKKKLVYGLWAVHISAPLPEGRWGSSIIRNKTKYLPIRYKTQLVLKFDDIY